MKRLGILVAFVLFSGPIWAQEASTNGFSPKLTVSGFTRVHYDAALSNATGWGKFSFYYAVLKVSAEPFQNLKLETSIDLGSFSGQRYLTNGHLGQTNEVFASANLFETAFASYSFSGEAVITAGRFWEYFAPIAISQLTRDGVSVSGNAFGFLSYGIQVFNDSMLGSTDVPLTELMVGVTPVKGLNIQGAGFYAAKPGMVRTGYSGDIVVKKWEALPALYSIVEVSGVVNSTNGSAIYGMDGYMMLGYSIGSLMPFVEMFGGDANFDPASARDSYFYVRAAVKWDVNAGLAFVPYVRYDILKKGAALADPWSVRFRMDAKF